VLTRIDTYSVAAIRSTSLDSLRAGNRTVFFGMPNLAKGGVGLVGGLTHKRLSVKQNFPGRNELLQEVKIKNIAGQHGTAMLSSCGK
jgi:hypothetical protein